MKRVFTYGAFDLLHPGHIRLLEKAKALGDCLIVGIVSDEAIAELKGDGRPIQPQADRMEIVKALECVYDVRAMNWYNPVRLLKALENQMGSAGSDKQGIEVLCKGDDWDVIPGEDYAKRMGMEFHRLPYSKEYSTSDIIIRIKMEDDTTIHS